MFHIFVENKFLYQGDKIVMKSTREDMKDCTVACEFSKKKSKLFFCSLIAKWLNEYEDINTLYSF